MLRKRNIDMDDETQYVHYDEKHSEDEERNPISTQECQSYNLGNLEVASNLSDQEQSHHSDRETNHLNPDSYEPIDYPQLDFGLAKCSID